MTDETATRTALEAKLAAAVERNRRLEAVGREMLACFTEESLSGLPELRTPWVPAGRVERWRMIVHQRDGKQSSARKPRG